MRYDPKTHHHRSIRLKGYDYTLPEAYFVTLVTHRRDPVFGEVSGGEMKLSALGQIVLDEWMRSIGIRKEIQLHEDEFVVMPNHSHGIVWMVGVTGVVGAYGIHPNMPEGNIRLSLYLTPKLIETIPLWEEKITPIVEKIKRMMKKGKAG